ncbi:HlyD family efflux transporter periplasmic adaptor subunit [Sulfuritalea sp.]|uniref:HlyD family efflux transporter periplasmic adaptor subunit n=1 Tax=Sulfuritalea sp. TaxID=2480090 RepID=UPI00286D9162|nr:HlyD family efflux transporter periplasmic adaptor subunit [Sulfuritalea sp.]
MRTVGGVVTAAQALMVSLQKDDALEVEAFLEDKDIGFVNAGQQAEVKIETFPFTKYGIIPASLIHVSHDAINDEKRGLIYSSSCNPRAPCVANCRSCCGGNDDRVKRRTGFGLSFLITRRCDAEVRCFKA